MELTKHKCWDILNDDERNAVILSLGHDKSTWEAGEIMSKSHYKYLEIQQRGVRFVQLFRMHYDRYEDHLIPEGVKLNPIFDEYLHLVMEKRKTLKEAIGTVDNPHFMQAVDREEIILEQMNLLYNTKEPGYQDLYELVTEFDRWNNFRILPPVIQMPSAFKRRNKTRFSKHLKNLLNLPEYSIDTIIQKAKYEGERKKWWMMIFTPHRDDYYTVIPVRAREKYSIFLSDCGMLIFTEKKDAEAFGELVTGYLGIGVKSCIDGQKFWPQFREMIRKAVNYKTLENITPSKKFLTMAFSDDDPEKVAKILKKKREQIERMVSGESRVGDNQFWGI